MGLGIDRPRQLGVLAFALLMLQGAASLAGSVELSFCRSGGYDKSVYKVIVKDLDKNGKKDCLVLEQDCRQSCAVRLALYPDLPPRGSKKQPREHAIWLVGSESGLSDASARLAVGDVNRDGVVEVALALETKGRSRDKTVFLYQQRQGKLVEIFKGVTDKTWRAGKRARSFHYKLRYLESKHDGARDIALKWLHGKPKAVDQLFHYSAAKGRYAKQ